MKTLILEDYGIAIAIESDALYAYDYVDCETKEETKGRLVEVCDEIAEALKEVTDIDISDYDVTISNERLIDIEPANNTSFCGF